MTNEKTIEILKELWRYEKTDKYSESEIREAIKNAIKAVEAVDYDCVDCKWYLEVKKNEMYTKDRQVTDGDLISRQAVIDLLNRFIEVEKKQGTDVMNYGRERVNAYESVLWEIESDYLFPSLPSAEKTAEWIDLGDVIQCPNCETLYPKVRVDLKHYCERCGSRMKGVE